MRNEQFEIAFNRIFDNEGGYQNSYDDRGNWTSGKVGEGELRGTKFGISAMTYPDLDIVNLTVEKAKSIYYVDWWVGLGISKFPKPLQYQLFDAAINHGMDATIKMLQYAIGVKADGMFGPRSKQALSLVSDDDVLLLFLSERLLFMTGIKTWKTYGKGWARRIAHNLRYASKDN